MLTYDDLTPAHKKLYDSASTPKEKMNILLHAEDQYNYERSVQNDQAMASQNKPITPTYGAATSPIDSTDAQTLKYLNSGANWSVGQAEKDRLLKNHPEVLQSSQATAPSYGYGLAPGQAWSNPSTPSTDDSDELRTNNTSTYQSPDDVVNKLINNTSPASSPVKLAAAPRQSVASASPSVQPASSGFFSKLFSGPSYQTTGGQTVQRQEGPMPKGQSMPETKLNWGNNDSNADFFRADQAMRDLQKSGEQFTGVQSEKRGGAVKDKPDHVHHALSIISHILGHKYAK